jgi:hypothetical protein
MTKDVAHEDLVRSRRLIVASLTSRGGRPPGLIRLRRLIVASLTASLTSVGTDHQDTQHATRLASAPATMTYN